MGTVVTRSSGPGMNSEDYGSFQCCRLVGNTVADGAFPCCLCQWLRRSSVRHRAEWGPGPCRTRALRAVGNHLRVLGIGQAVIRSAGLDFVARAALVTGHGGHRRATVFALGHGGRWCRRAHHRNERHAALRALAGLVFVHVAVLRHRAGVVQDLAAGMHLLQRALATPAPGSCHRSDICPDARTQWRRARASGRHRPLPPNPRRHAAPRFVWAARRRSARRERPRFGFAHFLDGLAELAFRIEHELAGGHHALAFPQPARAPGTCRFRRADQHDRARIKLAAVQRDEDRVLLAAAQDRRIRHEQGRRATARHGFPRWRTCRV